MSLLLPVSFHEIFHFRYNGLSVFPTLFPILRSPNLNNMAEKKATTSTSIFSKENYIWMLAGIVVIAIGMFLLAGGKSEDPTKFDAGEVYSTTRITVAPILILAGLVIEIFAIFRKPKG
jgi:magnesium-transporting ATPase (P-type)